jgi:seryl-tRNA(Sec) selenium transferase
MLQHKRSRELVSRTSSQQEMLNTAGSVKTCLVQRDNIEERNCDKLEEKSKKQQSPLISRRSLQFFLRRNIFSAF